MTSTATIEMKKVVSTLTKNHSLNNNNNNEHNPDETQRDISVDISQVHDTEYMEGLKQKKAPYIME